MSRKEFELLAVMALGPVILAAAFCTWAWDGVRRVVRR